MDATCFGWGCGGLKRLGSVSVGGLGEGHALGWGGFEVDQDV